MKTTGFRTLVLGTPWRNLTYLIIEKEGTKKYIQENILNIKSTIQTNSLDSHLTRIRKKMYKIKTSVKIQSKSEKLLIVI